MGRHVDIIKPPPAKIKKKNGNLSFGLNVNDIVPIRNKPFTTKNPFDELPDDDDMSSISSQSSNQRFAHIRRTRAIMNPPADLNKASSSTVNPTQTQQQQQHNKRKSLPPITITDSRMDDVMNHMLKLQLKTPDQIRFAYSRKFGVRIYTNDIENYKKVLEHAKKMENVSGYTHALKEDRFVRVCMYGLPYKKDTNSIALEMKRFEGIEPSKIRILYQNPNHPDEVVYLLYFKHGFDLSALNQVTGLFGIRTRFKLYRDKDPRPTQCSNCQSLGHGTQNCFRPPICVRCAANHKSKDCPLIPRPTTIDEASGGHNEETANIPKSTPKIAPEELKCALCQQTGHSAAYRRCPAKERYVQDLQLQTTRNQHQNYNNNRRPRQNYYDRDYPSNLAPTNLHPLQTSYHQYVPLQTSQPQNTQPTNSWNSRNQAQNVQRNNCNFLLTDEEGMEILNEFVMELMNCNDYMQQINCIGRIAMKFVRKFKVSAAAVQRP